MDFGAFLDGIFMACFAVFTALAAGFAVLTALAATFLAGMIAARR
jgi:hypothetical protein